MGPWGGSGTFYCLTLKYNQQIPDQTHGDLFRRCVARPWTRQTQVTAALSLRKFLCEAQGTTYHKFTKAAAPPNKAPSMTAPVGRAGAALIVIGGAAPDSVLVGLAVECDARPVVEL